MASWPLVCFCCTGQQKCQPAQFICQPVFATRRNVQPVDVQRRAEEGPVSRLQRGLGGAMDKAPRTGDLSINEETKILFGDTEAGTGDIMTAARALHGLSEPV